MFQNNNYGSFIEQYLHNPNISYALTENPDKGNLRESFILNQLAAKHEVTFSEKGNFRINGRFVVEAGGKRKTAGQIKGVHESFIAADDIETGSGNKIPLWLFGFLY